LNGIEIMNTTSRTSPQSVPSTDTSLKGRTFSKAKPIAARLGICSRTLFRWANDGKVARHKINSRVVLFDEAEVIAFIESTRVG
jgi:predicted DNA-binding transcriptional regulator AlpA